MHLGGGSPADGADGTAAAQNPDLPSKRQRVALDAAAGAAAGALSRVVVGPLDVIKIRFQVQLEPIGGAGAGGAGGSGGAGGAGAAAPPKAPPARMPGGGGGIGGVGGAFAAGGAPLPPPSSFAPKYRGLGHAFSTILREEGVAGLWRGTVPGVLLAVPYTAVQFVALQQVRGAAARWLNAPPPPPAPAAAAAAAADADAAAPQKRRRPRRAADALPPPTPQPLAPRPHPSWAFPAVSFASGAMAGAAGTVASYPFDLLRTTLAAQGEPRVYRGMIDAARGIVAASPHGPRALYRGLGVTLVEIVPYAALQFGLYDALNAAWQDAAEKAHARRLQQQQQQQQQQAQAQNAALNAQSQKQQRGARRASPAAAAAPGGALPLPVPASSSSSWAWYESDRLRYFACGLAAGLAAKLATHPLDVAKKRYQVAGLQRSLSYGRRVDSSLPARSLGQCLGDIWRREGARGLWKGSVPSVVKAAPAAAVTFVAYEAAAAWLLASATAANARGREEREAEAKAAAGGKAGGKGRRGGSS